MVDLSKPNTNRVRGQAHVKICTPSYLRVINANPTAGSDEIDEHSGGCEKMILTLMGVEMDYSGFQSLNDRRHSSIYCKDGIYLRYNLQEYYLYQMDPLISFSKNSPILSHLLAFQKTKIQSFQSLAPTPFDKSGRIILCLSPTTTPSQTRQTKVQLLPLPSSLSPRLKLIGTTNDFCLDEQRLCFRPGSRSRRRVS